MDNQTLTVRQPQHSSGPLTVAEILNQKALIQDAMKSAMQDGQHFGKIPGCGDKPTLLQPGAQTILLLFRMNPDYEVETIDLERGHREYRVKCRLSNSSGEFIGAGVGSCCTMEGKWRFRVAPKTLTDRPVPKEYWELRKSDPKAAQQLLGGGGFSTKKDDNGQWMIAEGSSEKVEHDNPADYYNTCLKMAKKRALVDATLTRTAASDIFTQDIEDIKENLAVYSEPEPAKATPAPAKTHSEPVKKDTKPRNESMHLGDVVNCEATLSDFREQTGSSARGPWTARFCTFQTPGGDKLEAGTFDKKLFEAIDVLKGQVVAMTYKPGKKPGTFELLSLEPADLVPMN